MKFKINQKSFLNEIQKLVGVIPSKTPIPILENFLFKLEKNQLEITATDLDISISVTVDVDAERNGDKSVPARKFLELLREMPDEDLVIESEGEWGVKITTSAGEYKIPGQDPDNFPVLPAVEKIADLSLAPERLKRFVDMTSFAVSKDPLRPALTGVFFNFEPEKLTVVATDGHRLSKLVDGKFTSGLESTGLIMPTNALNQLAKLLDDVSASVRFGIAKNHVVVEFERTTMFCRLIDGKYPPYDSVIPQDSPNDLLVETKELQTALRRVAILSNTTTHQVVFQVEQSSLGLLTEDSEFGSQGSETLKVEFKGANTQLAFNSHYLQEILKHVTTDKVLFKFGDASKPVLVFPTGEELDTDLLFLLMPIRMQR